MTEEFNNRSIKMLDNDVPIEIKIKLKEDGTAKYYPWSSVKQSFDEVELEPQRAIECIKLGIPVLISIDRKECGAYETLRANILHIV